MHAMTRLLVKITETAAYNGLTTILTDPAAFKNGLILNARPDAGVDEDIPIVAGTSGALVATAFPLNNDPYTMWKFYPTEQAWNGTR